MDAPNDTNDTPKKRARKGGPMTARARAAAQEVFLAAFAETGIITSAAVAAGIGRKAVYEWQEHDEAFSFRFNEARESANDVLRAEILRRAYEGVEEPVYQLAKYVGTVRKYSDTLLIFEAKRRMPEYRDKVDVHATVQGAMTYDINLAQDAETSAHANAILRRITALRTGESGMAGVSGE